MEQLLLSEDPSALKIAPKQQEMNLVKEVFTRLVKYWYWFILSLIVCVGSAKIYLRYTVPVYNVESRFLIKKQGGNQSDELAQLNIVNNNNDVGNELEILRTKLLMKRTVHRLNLNISYFSKGRFKSTELYGNAPFFVTPITVTDSTPGMSWQVIIDKSGTGLNLAGGEGSGSYHWGDTVTARMLKFVVSKNPFCFITAGEYVLGIRSEDDAALDYMGRTRISQSLDGTNVIQLDIVDRLPQRGVDVLSTLYDVYTQANVEDQNATADNTIDFINNRLTIVSNDLSGVETSIQQFKTANKVVDVAEQGKMAFSSSKELEKQVEQQDVQLEVVQSVEDYLKGKESRVVPSLLGIQDPTYEGLVQKYNVLVTQRDNLAATSKPNNPLVVQSNNQIETLKEDMLLSLENVKASLGVTRDQLEKSLDHSMGDVRQAPSKERAFLDISREQQIKQQLYLFLLQKREETAISKSGTLSNSRLIDPARNQGPISPNSGNILLTSLIIGLLIPASLIFLKEFMNATISDRRDITNRTNVPILGEVGHNKTGKPLIVETGTRTAIAEQFRAIRANLQFMLTGKRHQVILITSSMSGEGKSFVSLNMASSLAISGKKVVLLELDLRKPRLSSELGMPNTQGFTNYIVSNEDLKYLPKPVPGQSGLYLVGSGPIPPNPAELLMQDKVKTLFDYLYDNFDYIVIDTPPIGLVTDALTIASYADVSIYLTRQHFTFKEQIKLIDEINAQRKLKGLSIIINDYEGVKEGKYGYGYGYGNGGYYSDDEEKGRRRLFKQKRS